MRSWARRSTPERIGAGGAQHPFDIQATWPSGKARVCKILITGSNPVVASNQHASASYDTAKRPLRQRSRRALCIQTRGGARTRAIYNHLGERLYRQRIEQALMRLTNR